MTLVFLGSNLHAVHATKRAELEALMETFQADASTSGSSLLEFESLELFPPTKRNLLIARYRIAGGKLAALRRLQVACFELGLVSKEEHAECQNTDFVAHITLVTISRTYIFQPQGDPATRCAFFKRFTTHGTFLRFQTLVLFK